MRSAKKYELFDRKGLFLISDDNKKLVGDYRFNPPGYACLYLASYLYLAWEETRRPDFDTVNFSRFRTTKKIQVLSITVKPKMQYKEDFLMAYLMLLCCAKTNDEDKYKFQYIVPHLVMKALCLSQRKTAEAKGKMVYGIKYISSRRYDQKDLLFQDKWLSEAYVFPQHPHRETDGICPILSKLFIMTEPRTFFLYKNSRINFYDKKALISDYTDSLFYRLEQETSKDKLKRYDDDNKIVIS